MRNLPQGLNNNSAQNLYKREQYLAHYLYVSDYPDLVPNAYKSHWEGEDLPKALMAAGMRNLLRPRRGTRSGLPVQQ